MINAVRTFGLATMTALAFSAVPAGYAPAEELPLPTIDYESRAKLFNEGTLLVRHSAGRMRIEMQIPGVQDPVIGIIDLARKKMVMLLPIPGISNTAVEVDYGDDINFGQVLGNAQRAGTSIVAGEPCTLWKVDAHKNANAQTCIARDNIPLRTEAAIDGKQRVVFEVTEVRRQPQKAADFELPPNVKIMKLPKGLKGIPGMPGFN